MDRKRFILTTWRDYSGFGTGGVPVKKERFLILLVAVLLLTILRPLLPEFTFRTVILDGLFLLVFLSCINAVVERKSYFYLFLLLLILAITTRMAAHFGGDPTFCRIMLICFNSIAILFFLFTFIAIIAYILKGGKVTRDRLAASICAYLILGAVFSDAYSLMEVIDPGSVLSGNEGAASLSEDFNMDRVVKNEKIMAYFSYVTLTTLGYGDILPQTPAARSFAMLEALVGQLFIAVMIASLVGMHIAQKDG